MERQVDKLARRTFLAGSAAIGVLALSGCETVRQFSLVEAIRRLLTLASQRALDRLMAPNGFWDDQVARLNIPDLIGKRGNVIASILTSTIFKDRLQREFNHVAERGARRAAPLVAEAVRTVGIANARAIIDGGPTAATGFLRGAMADALIEAMVPELADALRISQEPLVAQALQALTGVDVAGVAREFSGEVDNAIWNTIGREESYIRADPRSTNDPVLIGVFSL
jgi:hypothetical protein